MAHNSTRFGEQALRGVVRRRHWNLKLIAFETGVGYSHLLNAVNGVAAPSPELREKLSEFLGLPVEKLFSPEALAANTVRAGRSAARSAGVRKARGVNPDSELRQAGAEAGRKARARRWAA